MKDARAKGRVIKALFYDADRGDRGDRGVEISFWTSDQNIQMEDLINWSFFVLHCLGIFERTF